ncbi:MAG: SUMF1/EgtB/PvdO family nonheme iron enzyme [Thermoguttaceae bacterium]|nr:SUMF1/EgtB/PvdO family nonheme iron enzyme [Thermoguttaceae bacterium]
MTEKNLRRLPWRIGDVIAICAVIAALAMFCVRFGRVRPTAENALDQPAATAEASQTTEAEQTAEAAKASQASEQARENGENAKEPAPPVDRAVLIGVDHYLHFNDLKYASADVELIRERLEDCLGFQKENIVAITTEAGKDDTNLIPNVANIERELMKAIDATGPDDAIFIFFSGHGFQTDNFGGYSPYVGFAPYDTTKTAGVVDFEATYSLSRLFKRLAETEARFKWIVVDACREKLEPASEEMLLATNGRRRGGLTDGATALGRLNAPTGSVLLQSCDAGQFSYEYDELKHGVFTYHFARCLSEKGDMDQDGNVRLFEALNKTSEAVEKATNGSQEPHFISDTTNFKLFSYDPFIINPEGNDASGDWDHASAAGERMTLTIADIEVGFCWAPPGTFTQGTPDTEPERCAPYETQREVTLTQGFWLMETETTQQLWTAVVGENPSEFTLEKRQDMRGLVTASFPVDSVNWYDCCEFAEKLNAAGCAPKGWKFALPTEAQWEYACRAGTSTPFFWGDSLNGDKANCDGVNYPYQMDADSYQGRPTNVGSYEKNPWGFYDMHGNVEEWCADIFGTYSGDPVVDPTGATEGTDRALRGGGWRGRAKYCRSGNRFNFDPNKRFAANGCRLALIPDGATLSNAEEAAKVDGTTQVTAHKNEAERLYREGRALALGLDGRKIDSAAASEALEKSVDLGSLDAQAELAALLLTGGDGVEASVARAFNMAEDPANDGNPLAQNVLAICYRDGLGVGEDAARAEEYFKKACEGFVKLAEQGDAPTLYILAERYANGEGVAQNAETAAKFFRQAADADYLPAILRFAECCATGDGVEANVEEATTRLRKAAESVNCDLTALRKTAEKLGLDWEKIAPKQEAAPSGETGTTEKP